MRRTWLLVASAAVVMLSLAWVTREAVVDCWGYGSEAVCTLRNRWTGKLSTRTVEQSKARYVLPPDSVRAVNRLPGHTGPSQPNPYTRFRR